MEKVGKSKYEKWKVAQNTDFRWYAERMYKPEINEWLQVLEFFKPFLDQTGKVVVEIGCGPTGGILKFMKARLRVGIEPLANQFLHKGFELIKETEIIYLNSYGEEVPLVNEFADIVTCIHSLGHAQNPYPVLEEAHRILKTGGELWVMDLIRTFDQCTKDHPFKFEKDGLMAWLQTNKYDSIRIDTSQFIDEEEKRLPLFYGIFKKKHRDVDLSNMIAFSDGRFEDQICGGWYSLEDGEKPFRWVSNKFSAYLLFEANHNSLILEGYVDLGNIPETALTVSVTANDIIVGEHTFFQNGPFFISFPVTDKLSFGKVRIKGKSSSFFNPHDVNGCGDNRELAFIITRMGFC
jgi:ubiquinone/menaquinone biosynthesis C-methylase UbiE